MTKAELEKKIDLIVDHPKWNAIIKQNIETKRDFPEFNFNFEGLVKNMNKTNPDVAIWSESYGLWPGRVWAQFATYSNWIHLSTNTLPFYDVFPRLQGRFPSNDFNTFGNDESENNHWIHESEDDSEMFHLSNRMWRWLRNKDGVHVLLNDRTEVGAHYLPDRGTDASVGTGQGEYTPEHVHHNYRYTSKFISQNLLEPASRYFVSKLSSPLFEFWPNHDLRMFRCLRKEQRVERRQRGQARPVP